MGRSPCCDKSGLKKGPWTQEEDLKLTQYIHIHGPGNWRTLPKNAGLQRYGKSCRLRWTNYLRPDIKRGGFSFDEEETIIQLHSVIGNKWSVIASRLPGRTDNEIKNYWNTHIRKRLLKNGIDPVTHRPRVDLFDLWSILKSASLISLSKLLNPQHATLSASSNQGNKDQLFHINQLLSYMNQSSNEQTANQLLPSNQLLDQQHHMEVNNGNWFSNNQTSQENSIPPHIIDDSVILQNYNHQFTSENSNFQPSTTENDNLDINSVFPTPISSPTVPLESSSMFINGREFGDEWFYEDVTIN